MINFASLFGTFNRGGNSAISDLLQKRGTTLDQLLDVDTFPNEYKSGNNKILQFMNYQKYQELINYVTVEGPADNQKKGFKFPMVAADVLSAENNAAIDLFLPDGQIQVEVQYKETQQIEIQVDDNDEQYLTEQSPKKEQKTQQVTQQTLKTQEIKPEPTQQNTQVKTEQTQQPQNTQSAETTEQSEQPLVQSIQAQEPKQEVKQVVKQEVKQKKKKLIKEQKVVTKTRKQKRDPLIAQLLSYYEGPINYTLAGYNCKVLSLLFTKKPTQFLNFFFKSNKNYTQIVCNHIESKSVGDLITKILVWENTQYVQQRKGLYYHLIYLMSEVKQSHVISNLSYTINEIIQKTSTYIKSKQNIANNQQIIKAFLAIFYRTSEVHKIVNNAMSQDENRSGYNSMVLHAYLHHTEIQTFNSFKLQEVLQSFILKASQKLRNIPNRRTLGMGRVKIVQIFSFLIRKPPQTVEEDGKQTEMTSELLEELYVHTLIANVADFFSILIKLVQSFENNNILHNEFFRIIESVLKEPEQNKSALQQLLLNDQNVLLKFIVAEAQKDKIIKSAQKHTKRKGYIGHVINICKLIDQINNNQLLKEKIKNTSQFQDVLNTMVAVDITQTNKSLAGYQVKKNPAHEIMFQKEDILTAYAEFLTHCPKPQYQPEEPESSEQQSPEPITLQAEDQNRKAEQLAAQKQMQEQERDEQKFNEVAAMSQLVDESNPKFWITHINYDVDQLIQDVL